MSNKGRIVTIIGGILGVFILFYLFFVILPSGTFKTVTEGQKTSVAFRDNVFAYKTAYVGDNSKVSYILDKQGYPEEIIVEKFEILSQAEPYGLRVYLSKVPKDANKALLNNALLTFSLIDNLSNLYYIEDKSDQVIATYEREKALQALEEKEENSLGAAETAQAKSV
jgi:hypothetical protein